MFKPPSFAAVQNSYNSKSYSLAARLAMRR